jgi:signal transduction histidine kinase
MMSSLENIYMKMSPTIEPGALANLHHVPVLSVEVQKQIGREVAHELNNVLTIIRGYADRLIIKHGDNPALRPELKLISENARRAELVVRAASQARQQADALVA